MAVAAARLIQWRAQSWMPGFYPRTKMADYERYLPDHERDFRRRSTLAQMLHLYLLLLTPLLVLMFGGLFILYSGSDASWDTVIRQIRNQTVAIVAMLGAAQIRVETYRRWAPVLYVAGLLLLVAVPLVGVGAKGAQRWLSLGVVRFQP